MTLGFCTPHSEERVENHKFVWKQIKPRGYPDDICKEYYDTALSLVFLVDKAIQPEEKERLKHAIKEGICYLNQKGFTGLALDCAEKYEKISNLKMNEIYC